MIARRTPNNFIQHRSTASTSLAMLLSADPPCLCPWARTLWRVFPCDIPNRTHAEERTAHAMAKSAGEGVDDGE